MTTDSRTLLRAARLVLAGAALSLAAVTANAASEDDESKPAEATYLRLHPDFIVNLLTEGKRPHFLLATIEVMTRGQEAAETAKFHLPAIRHELLLLLSDQPYKDMKIVEKREALRVAALERINGVLEREIQARPVEGLYFTQFVVE